MSDGDEGDGEHAGGAPPGNDFAVGNPGGGAPVGNQNAATHHLHSDPDNLLSWLESHEPDAYQWVRAKYESYLEDAPFQAGTAKADQLLQVAAMEYALWKAQGIQIREGVLKQTHMRSADGDLVEVVDEHPVNQPLDRMAKRATRRLKELGVLGGEDEQPPRENYGNEYYDIVFVDAEEDENGAESAEEGADGA